MKKTLFFIIAWGFTVMLQAQEFIDLVRYSNIRQGGTARSMGMGGAIGAAGIDYSVSSVNPASLAQIRTSNAMISTALNFGSNRANYIGTDVKDSRFSFSLPNMGIVFSQIEMRLGKEKAEGLVSYSFAFGYNRTNDFNRNLTVDGVNTNSSYLDYLAEVATDNITWANVSAPGFQPFFRDELALFTGGIIRNTNTNRFEAHLLSTSAMRQNYRLQQSGRQHDWNITWAGNFSHRLFIGVGIGIPTIRFKSTTTFIEKSQDAATNPQRTFEQTNFVSTSGTGINAKLGITLRAANWLRIGAAYHTPTSYALGDEFSYSMLTTGFPAGNFVYNSGQTLNSGPGEFNYNFTTPGRSVFSAALIFKKMGMLSFDYELVDYKQAQSSTKDLTFMNSLVRENLGNANNFRIGGEFNYIDYRFRAGYAIYAPAFNKSILNRLTEGNLNLQVFSAGAGYQPQNSAVFFDFAVVVERYDDFYTPYNLTKTNRTFETALNKVSNTRIVFTLGSRL